MSQKRPFRRTAAVALVLTALASTVLAVTTFLTVSPTNLQGWQIQVTTSATATPTPSVTFVNGPDTPPLGTGSAELRVGANGGDAAQLRHPGFAGTRLPNPTPTPPAANELSALTYSTYVQQDGSGGQAPYIILQIDTDGDAGIEDLLFFEPVYQSATFCPSNPQPALVVGQWQTWDALNGCWYSVFGTAGSGPGTNTVSLRTLSAALPTAQIANSSPSGLGGVRLVTGFGAGAWDDFIGNADAFRIGVGANDTVYNFDPTQSTPIAGALLISEFRARGLAGSADEFVEVYNNTDSTHVVTPPDGSGGYAVATEDGQLRCTVPFGTVIPPRGHFLCAGTAYSLGAYASGDAAISGDIGDAQGLAFFSTTNPANFNAGTSLDAVGYTTSPALYREGTGFPFTLTQNVEQSVLRSQYKGFPLDNGNNANDFLAVNARPDVQDIGVALGAPGPENLASPTQRNAQAPMTMLDNGASSSALPNRERNLTPVPNGALGTLRFRRRITNNTTEDITHLRIRVVDITTRNSPAAGTSPPGQAAPCNSSPCADLRVLSSSNEAAVATTGGPVTTQGTTIEVPPAQPSGGAYNSSLSVNDVTLANPIPPGGTVNINILVGVQQGGSFRFHVNIELLTAPPAPPSNMPLPSPDEITFTP
ncbi:MAG TPA: hypothetical protein VFX96_02010 [Pyrinomonadaceae bacterium]|nr:hypothetical protein [Pyrinomonadaceae bacterium]